MKRAIPINVEKKLKDLRSQTTMLSPNMTSKLPCESDKKTTNKPFAGEETDVTPSPASSLLLDDISINTDVSVSNVVTNNNPISELSGKKNPIIKNLSVTVARKCIQGGLSNKDYDQHNLYDWRLQHHYVTDYFKMWQNYDKQGDDSKFTDCQSKDDKNKKAEGKPIRKDGVTLSPSVDNGAGRKFNGDNLNTCFELNSHYYLYDRGAITDTAIEFIIYMVPIHLIKEWYVRYGNCKGKISKKNIDKCIGQCEFDKTTWRFD